MVMFRRLVLLLLLLAVPFQVSLGATGLACATVDHHFRQLGTALHGDDIATADGHHGEAVMRIAHRDPIADSNAVEPDDAAGKCELCSECCVSAAALPGSRLTVAFLDPSLPVSSTVDPDVRFRAGDALFRPPRTLAA